METTTAQLYPSPRFWLIGFVLFLLIAGVSLYQPFILLAWAPLVLGPIHILYDIKYLVIKPMWYRRALWWLACALPLAISVYTGSMVAWSAFILLAIFFGESIFKKVLGVMIGMAGLFLIRQNSILWGYVAIYVHNLVTLFLWMKFRKEAGVRGLLLVAAVTLLSFAVYAGYADGIAANFADSLGQKNWNQAAYAVVPASVTQVTATRLAVIYIFLQMVHYLAWLYLIPQGQRPSLRTNEVGEAIQKLNSVDRLMLVGTLFMTLALIIYGYFHVWDARLFYLKLGGFHVYLEVLMLYLFWLTGGRYVGEMD